MKWSLDEKDLYIPTEEDMRFAQLLNQKFEELGLKMGIMDEMDDKMAYYRDLVLSYIIEGKELPIEIENEIKKYTSKISRQETQSVYIDTQALDNKLKEVFGDKYRV